ncbi:hypothetical protein F7725_021468, partial [Dissostichus mawsoni]
MEDAQSSVSSVSSQQDSADTMRSVLQEICDFRAEHKVDLNKLKEEIKGDMKSELEDMKKEIYQKLSANSALTQAHETRLKEAEERIDEAETYMAMSDALIKSMKEQRAVQGKLVDLEGRSRRNNMCIRVPEEKEDTSRQDAHSLGLGNTHIHSAQDAAQELRRRDFSVDIPDRNFGAVPGDGASPPDQDMAA